MIDYDDKTIAASVKHAPEGKYESPNFYNETEKWDDMALHKGFKGDSSTGCAPYVELTPERKAELIAIYTAMYPERHK